MFSVFSHKGYKIELKAILFNTITSERGKSKLVQKRSLTKCSLLNKNIIIKQFKVKRVDDNKGKEEKEEEEQSLL